MKIKKDFFLFFGILSVCIFCLFFFRKMPTQHLWKGYDILYVSTLFPESSVMETLNASGCRNIISLSNQRNPTIARFCPIEKKSGSYLEKREAYFFDEQHNYRIFYIPDTYSKKTEKALQILIDKKVDAGIDTAESLSWLSMTVCLFLFIVFVVHSENRIVYSIAALFPILFVFSRPFYENAAAVCLILYAFYFVQEMWLRKSAVHYLATHPSFTVFIIIPIFLTFPNALVNSILFSLILGTSFTALAAYRNFEIVRTKKTTFSPVPIRPAELIPIVTKKTLHYMLLCAASVCILILFFLSSTRFFPPVFSKDLSLPAPTRYTEHTVLPTLTDYIVWTWTTMTYPYRSLNDTTQRQSKLKDGDTVIIPRYEKTVTGIREKNATVFQYDATFRESVINDINKLPYPALEQLLKRQGKLTSADYLRTGTESFVNIRLVLLILALIVPIIVFTFMVFGRKKR